MTKPKKNPGKLFSRLERISPPRAALVATIALFALTGCASGEPNVGISPSAGVEPTKQVQSDKTEQTLGEPTDSGLSSEVWAAANNLEDTETLPFAANYGGMTFGLDGDADQIVVFLTNRNQALENEVKRFLSLPGGKVSFRDASLTWDELNALNSKIQADIKDQGTELPIRAVGINSDLKVFIRTARALNEFETAQIREKYGEMIVLEVDQGGGTETVDRDPSVND